MKTNPSVPFIHFILCFILLPALPPEAWPQPAPLTEGLSKITTADSDIRYMEFSPDAKVTYQEFINLPFREKFGLDSNNTWAPKSIGTGPYGQRHIRLQQFYKGKRVIGAEYVLHESGRYVRKANGDVASGLQLETEAAVSETLALASALDFMGASLYAWEEPAYESLLKEIGGGSEAANTPSGELVIIATIESPSEYTLAYEFDIFALKPYARKLIYVDARDGKVVNARNLAFSCNVPGTGRAACATPGLEILTDSCGGPFFRLRSSHNITFNAHHTASNPSSDFVDGDNIWEGPEQESAVAAHWAAQQFYNYFNETFNWQGIDGGGMKLRAWVNFGSNYAGAFWLGNWANFGGGDGLAWGPMNSMDIVVHEFTHGAIQYSSGLENQYEAGAINEGLCDFFACVLEHKYHPDGGNWSIGECPDLSFGEGVRNLSNPNAKNNPDTYQGNFWVSQDNCLASPVNDFCGVHKNSTVISHFFYLLSEGGAGAGDFGQVYNLEGIGQEKTARLAFQLMAFYLTPTSNFADFRALAISASNDIPGFGPFEQGQLSEALCAVGLESCGQATSSLSLSAPNGGEVFQIGESAIISWETEGAIGLVRLQYSINGGSSWIQAADSLDNTGVYEWEVPSVNSYQCRVRIIGQDNPLVQDQSDGNFAIFGCNTIAHFEANADKLCPGQAFIATNTSSVMAADIGLEFEWEIDGELVSTDPEGISYNFSSAGLHTVTLHAIVNETCMDTYSREVLAYPEPTGEFEVLTDGLALHLNAFGLNAHAFIWTLDGINLENDSQAFTATVETAGEYEVCLITISRCGNSPQACQTVEVTETGACAGNEPGWQQFVNGNHIIDLTEDSLFLWLATDVGLTKWGKSDGATTQYNIYNSALSTDQLTAVEVSRGGLVWVGTRDQGLFTFDGAIWTNHNIFETAWLPDNWIKDITADGSGAVWIGTNNGLVKYDGLSNQVFYTFDGLPSNTIDHIETSEDGAIWVGSEGGLGRLKDGVWTAFNSENSPLPGNVIHGMASDGEQGIWLTAQSSPGLVHFDGADNWENYNTDNIPEWPAANLEHLTVGPLGHIWAGTIPVGNGSLSHPLLAEFDGAEIRVHDPGLTRGANFTKFLIGLSGDFWVGSDEGLFKRTGESWELQDISEAPLPSNAINGLVIDGEGNKWLATNKGVVKISDSGWIVFNTSNSGLASDVANAITIDSTQNIWIGTDRGAVRYNGNTWLHFPLSNSPIYDIELAPGGAIWFGGSKDFGYPEGSLAILYKLDNGLWTEYSALTHNLGNAHRVVELEFNESGRLWVGTYRNPFNFPGNDYRVYVFDGGTFHQMVYGYVRGLGALKADTSDHMWIGMTGSLLGGFPGDPALYYFKDTTVERYYDGIYAEDIRITENHGAVFGSEGHIFQLDSLGNVINLATLPSAESSAIELFDIDARGNIWVGANGLRVYEAATPALTASFYPNTENICAPQSATFINTTAGAEAFLWKVGNDTISTNTNLQYQFLEPGAYTISLTATNDEGCATGLAQLITVNPGAESLPAPASLSVCDGSALLEAAPGMASYEWRLNNIVVANTRTLSATGSGLYQLTVADRCGGVATVAVPVLLDPSCVWPGDANQDNIANHYDLLKIGEAFGFAGPARPEASAAWAGQPAPGWAGFFAGNINVKHADMNGDGIVDNADLFVLSENYGFTHGVPDGAPSPAVSPVSLKPVIAVAPTEENGWQMEIDIQVQNGEGQVMDNIYGVAFNLYFSFPELELGNPPLVNFDDSSLGTPWVGLLSISRYRPEEQLIEAAVTRTNHQNHTGTSTIGSATFSLVIDDNLAIDDTLALAMEIRGTLMTSNDGSIIPVGNSNLQFNLTGQGISSTQAPDEEGLFSIYPNPGKGLYFLETKVTPARKIAVYNQHGTEVWASGPAGQVLNPTIDLRHLPSGVYWMAIYSRGREPVVKKVVKF